MRKNLLVAAAITAILSGCGGGDEGGSSNNGSPKQSGNNDKTVVGKAEDKSETSSESFPERIPVIGGDDVTSVAYPSIPQIVDQRIPREDIQLTPNTIKQRIPDVPDTSVRDIAVNTHDVRAELNEYMVKRGLVDQEGTYGDIPSQIASYMNNGISNGIDKEAALANAKRQVDVLTQQEPTVLDNNQVPYLTKDKVVKENNTPNQQPQATPQLVPDFEQDVPTLLNNNGIPNVPVAQEQGIPLPMPSKLEQGEPDLLETLNNNGVPTLTATKGKQGKPEAPDTSVRDIVISTHDVRAELNEYMVKRGLVDQEGTYGDIPSQIASYMNNGISNGIDKEAALANAKRQIDALSQQEPSALDNNRVARLNAETKAKREKPTVQPIVTPYLIPTEVIQETPPQVAVPEVAYNDLTPPAAMIAIAKKDVKGDAYVVPETAMQRTPTKPIEETVWKSDPDRLERLQTQREQHEAAFDPDRMIEQDIPTPTVVKKDVKGDKYASPIAIPVAIPEIEQQAPHVDVTRGEALDLLGIQVGPDEITQGEPTIKKAIKGTAYVVPKQTIQFDVNQVRDNQARGYADIQGEIVEYGLTKGLEGYEISQIGFIAHDMINSGDSAQGALANAKLNIDRVYNARQETPAEIAQGTPTPAIIKKNVKGDTYVAPIAIPAAIPEVEQQKPHVDVTRGEALDLLGIQVGPESIDQGEPELFTFEETYFEAIDVAPEAYNVPEESIEETVYLTPEVVQQQSVLLESVCLTNTEQFVKTTGSSNSGGLFTSDVQSHLNSDEDRLSYSMEIFTMLQQVLANNPDLQEAVAGERAGQSTNIKGDKKWTLTMDTGASYTLSTATSQSYHPNVEITVSNNGAIVFSDGNGIETARIVSNNQNGDCTNASYDVVLAN